MNATGLTARIFRDRSMPDCSNHGISTRTEAVVVVAVVDFGPQDVTVIPVDGPTSVRIDRLPVALVKRRLFGREVTVSAQPFGDGIPLTGWMAGGTYIGSTDERFREAAGFYGAVSLHDRR